MARHLKSIVKNRLKCAISYYAPHSEISASHRRGVRYLVPVVGIDMFWGAMSTHKEGRHYRKHIIVRRVPRSGGQLLQLYSWDNHPSGFRLISGTETNGRSLSVADFAEAAPGFDTQGVTLRTSASVTAGFEAEWFLSNNLFLSAIGRYTLSQAKLEIPSPSLTAWGEQLHIYHGNLSIGWAMPVAKGIRFGARTLWGVRYNESVTFHRVAEGHQMGESLLSINSQLRPEGGAGIVIDMLQSHNQTIGFNIDYLHTFGTSFMANRWVIASSWKAMF